MTAKWKLLFVQIPQLDNDVQGAHENVRLAAFYLSHALARTPEARHWTPSICPPEADRLDDRHLVDLIVSLQPDVLAVTLYLWNIERTLRVCGDIRQRLPHLLIAMGGPEVAPRHPFLFRTTVPNVAAVGEGEAVFPGILRALRSGQPPDFRNVAWREGRRFRWGREPAPSAPLRDLLPPPEHPMNQPDARGVAYLETTRGCPMHCAFCCYNQRRRGVSALSADDVADRVRVLRRRGAREIRLIDPTFNVNPEFERILQKLKSLNQDRRLRFFAELHAESVTQPQAMALMAAGFREIEAGVQSMDPGVLKAVRRPTDLAALRTGIEHMARRGIRLTIDVMCGLPGQTLTDIRRTVRWAVRVKGASVQLLHTLLLPGTELRDRAVRLGLQANPRPPYRVLRTPTLPEAAFRAADDLAARLTGKRADCPTRRLVGYRLPDLFPERVRVQADVTEGPIVIPGCGNRRALLLVGDALFVHRRLLADILRQAISTEPHVLWQFVLCVRWEEPLDLLDTVIGEVQRHPPHLLDRMTITGGERLLAARRVFIQLRRGRVFDPAWLREVRQTLERCFR